MVGEVHTTPWEMSEFRFLSGRTIGVCAEPNRSCARSEGSLTCCTVEFHHMLRYATRQSHPGRVSRGRAARCRPCAAPAATAPAERRALVMNVLLLVCAHRRGLLGTAGTAGPRCRGWEGGGRPGSIVQPPKR
jgi:hypothetical protein